jgi:uncharacterized protein
VAEKASRPADQDSPAERISTEVYVIPLGDRHLVYAPLRRLAFFATAQAINLLSRLRWGPVAAASADEAAFLAFCRRVRLTGVEGDFPISTFEFGRYAPTEVTLFLTTRCNLRCTYCYASAGDRHPIDMSLATARRGIDYVARNALTTGRPAIAIGYHGGGEPTVHWSVLTESFAYAERLGRERGLAVSGSMATNGVLSPEQRRWVVEHFPGVNVSVDGLPLVQDRQRPLARGGGSSRLVLETLRAFDAAGFEYGLRLTVTAEAAEHLEASVAYLIAESRPRHIQVEPMYALGRGASGARGVDPAEFVARFRAAKALAAREGVDFFFSAARVDVLTNRFCTSCGEGFSLTPEGLVSGCYEVPGPGYEHGDDFLFGRFDEAFGDYALNLDRLEALRQRTVERIPWCDGCFCRWHCAGDCVYKTRHALIDGKFRGGDRCEVTRALTLDQILEKIALHGGDYWADAESGESSGFLV